MDGSPVLLMSDSEFDELHVDARFELVVNFGIPRLADEYIRRASFVADGGLLATFPSSQSDRHCNYLRLSRLREAIPVLRVVDCRAEMEHASQASIEVQSPRMADAKLARKKRIKASLETRATFWSKQLKELGEEEVKSALDRLMDEEVAFGVGKIPTLKRMILERIKESREKREKKAKGKRRMTTTPTSIAAET